MRQKTILAWLILAVSLFCIVRDTNAIPLGSYLTRDLVQTWGTTIGIPTNSFSVGYQFTTFSDDWIDSIYHYLWCVKITTNTTDGYLFTAGILPLSNNGTAWVDYILTSSGNYRYVNYLVHNDATSTDSVTARNPAIEGNTTAITDFVLPKNINSWGSSPWEWVLCINSSFRHNFSSKLFDLIAITYWYYWFTDWTFLYSTTDFTANPILISSFFPNNYYTNIHNYYNTQKQALFSESSASWTVQKYIRTNQQSNTSAFYSSLPREFMWWTWSLQYVWWNTLPMHFWYSIQDNTYSTWWTDEPWSQTDYFEDCGSFLDVWCYVSGFFDWIVDKITGFFDYLFPDISFNWSFNSCWTFDDSEAIWLFQRFANIIAFINPFPPEETIEICTIYWPKTISYQVFIPDNNFFKEWIPWVLPEMEDIDLRMIYGQTPIDLIVILWMLSVILYQRSKHD